MAELMATKVPLSLDWVIWLKCRLWYLGRDGSKAACTVVSVDSSVQPPSYGVHIDNTSSNSIRYLFLLCSALQIMLHLFHMLPSTLHYSRELRSYHVRPWCNSASSRGKAASKTRCDVFRQHKSQPQSLRCDMPKLIINQDKLYQQSQTRQKQLLSLATMFWTSY